MADRTRPRVTAGVLLTCTTDPGGLEVAVVHRPRYDDWTLPKGGVERGEHVAQAAAREALEETGYEVTLGRRLPATRYDHDGGSTRVHWWLASARGASAGPPDVDEVDQVRWVGTAEAASLLSYPSDRNLLSELEKRPPGTHRVILLRHASAGDRKLWKGPDGKRPLDRGGRLRATRLASVLPAFEPAHVITATPLRCRDTVEPLAAALGQPLTVDRRFDDTTWHRGPKPALRALQTLAGTAGVTVVCSQGETIPGVISELVQSGASKAARSDIRRASNSSGPRSRKGSFWVLSFAEGELVAADYIAD